MATISITEAELGTVIATDGLVNKITVKELDSSHAGYRQYFTLTDAGPGYERTIFNIDPSTSAVGADDVLLADMIAFQNLTVKSIPAGSTFEVETVNAPALTSLSPTTAVTGPAEPDFTLSCIGTDFTARSVIFFGIEDEPTTLVSATEVTTIVKPSIFSPDTVPVKVRTGPAETASIGFVFT
jgi:hypothetical protein